MNDSKTDALKRMAYIEGHLRGIKRMIDEDAYCVDVLKQTYAVQKAIDKLEEVLLKGHLASCVPEAFAEGRSEQALSELSELFELARR